MVVKNNISGMSAAINQSLNRQMSFLANKSIKPEFSIKVANTLEEREAVFLLAHQVYLEKGYVQDNQIKMLIQDYDFDPNTVILIVKDQEKKVVGSLTMVFEGNSKLPAMKLFNKEIEVIRTSETKIVEISRLVIDKNYRNAKDILLLLINYLFIYTHHIKNYSDIAIQVNPRHVNYYKALLCFEEISAEKPCPLVQNAPAVLLSVKLKRYQSELVRCNETTQEGKRDRTLYRDFLKPNQEQLVAFYLEKQITPMTMEEKNYFCFTPSNTQLVTVN